MCASRAVRVLARLRVRFTLGLPHGRVSCQRLPEGVGGFPAQLQLWKPEAASLRDCPRWATAAGSRAVMSPTTEEEGGDVGEGKGPRKTLVELSSRVPHGFARLVAAGFGR